jgi:Peptidase family M28
MLNGRLYRAAFLPFLLALGIAAFSLAVRPAPLTSTLAPDAFEGAPVLAELNSLAQRFPDRRAGSPGDQELATHVAHSLEALGGTAGGGFTVHVRRFSAHTTSGERTLTTVIAVRPGSTSETPIVILAHRDAASAGPARAELSGTAALLALARVFATRETRRTIVLVSTSAGSAGAAGAKDFADMSSQLLGGGAEGAGHGTLDAAIVLGDLANARARKPFVVPYSDGYGSAPLQLQRTVSDAISHETGSDPGAPSTIGQLAHLALPFTVGEQGPLDAAGIPAVLVQVSGERGPSSRDGVSQERLEAVGRGVLSAVDALDAAPDASTSMQSGLLVQRQTMPAWALRLLIGALLLPPLIVTADGFARLRRREEPVGRWTLWALACALPFLACALFTRLLGLLDAISAMAPEPAPARALPLDFAAARAVLAVGLVLALAWLLWPALMRRLGLAVRPSSDAAGLAMLIVLLAVCVIVWAINPFTALLLLPAAHLWLLVVSPELRLRPPAALVLVAVGLLPLVLFMSFYARELGFGLGGLAWTAVLLFAGGSVGLGAAILWSLAAGCAAACAMVALVPAERLPSSRPGAPGEISIRGPLSYAGPGSLGGTESALRR